ncbi:hypothetical protein CEXT_369281 [Caerostris extrusa]|uniref:Uncharacterized protein n=1 Tax=Caerostris extrusa TaxID=172846 RepID=A0AAV4XK63_CAEEX|nr:hypothetical protein CEXT_369281 [Caerostris extrusa]
MTVFLEMTLFDSGMIAHEQHKLRNSELIPAHLKEHSVTIMYCSFAFITLIGHFSLQHCLDIIVFSSKSQIQIQLWICISVFRSRARIRQLTKELYRISKHAAFLHHPEIENVEGGHLGVLFIRGLHYCSLCSDVCQFWDDNSRTVPTA